MPGRRLGAWRVVDARFGSDAPSLRKVTNLLEQLLGVVARLGGAPVADSADEAAAATDGTGAGIATAAASAGARGVLQTREDALRELDRIAEYFRRTEPHSPLAYTLEEAVRRGRMSLAELLMEVLPDQQTRNGMLARLGMRPSE